MTANQIEVLLVEDDPGDVVLIQEALAEQEVVNRLSVVRDGVDAMSFLRRTGRFADAPRPDLVLLDLNLPRKNGREVLAESKGDPDLRLIPMVVLTTSSHGGGHRRLVPAPRQRLHHEAGRLRALHRGGPPDRRVLRRPGDAAPARAAPARPGVTRPHTRR